MQERGRSSMGEQQIGSFPVAMPEGMGRILVVDDDADVRAELGGVLQDAGFGVDVAKDGAEALELLKSRPAPSLILLDLKMPVMNGWQFCRAKAAEARLRKIPVVVLSAAGELEGSDDPIQAQALLPKPLDVDRLLDTVRAACG